MKNKFLLLLAVPFIFITSCATKTETPVSTEVTETPEVSENQETVPETTPTLENDENIKIEDTQIEEVLEVYDEDEIDIVEDVEEIEEIEEIEDEDDEYLRSIDSLSSDETVTRSEFADDKTAVINIINNLSSVISSQNFNEWKKYIDQESIEYYQNPANLRAAQKKLPNKTIQLKGLRDYFINVFIPSRQRSQVDEIRYISKTNIKAVQVKPDLSTIVYYYFVKIDGKWYVHLPPVS